AVLRGALRKMMAGGSTRFYDAVSEAAAHRLAGQPGRRVIVVITDGMDNSSRASLKEALEIAQKNDVIIFAISTNRLQQLVLPEQKLGDENLELLSLETGGRVVTPTKLEDLSRAFEAVSKELRSQYSLAYKPTNARRDGTYRQIRIVPVARKTL